MSLPTDELIPTRTTLIQRLKNWQDQSSWQVFFDTYWKLIYSVARKGGLTETEAQEVVQETMISVAKHMPTFTYDRNIGSFKAWLLNMTRWRMADQLRKRANFTTVTSSSNDPVTDTKVNNEIADPVGVNLEAFWEIEWGKNLLDTAISSVKRRIDPEKYQIFDFYVNKGWAAPKVAKTFGISVAQVYLAKHRVTEMIKNEVEQLRTSLQA